MLPVTVMIRDCDQLLSFVAFNRRHNHPQKLRAYLKSCRGMSGQSGSCPSVLVESIAGITPRTSLLNVLSSPNEAALERLTFTLRRIGGRLMSSMPIRKASLAVSLSQLSRLELATKNGCSRLKRGIGWLCLGWM